MSHKYYFNSVIKFTLNIEINEQSCLTELAEVQPIDEKKYFLQTDKDSFPLQIGTQETDEMKKKLSNAMPVKG